MRIQKHNGREQVLLELYIGIGVWVCILMLIGAFFMRPFWIFALALIVGGGGACLQAYSIYDTLDRALELPRKNAKSFATGRSILRLILCMGLMAGGIMIHWVAFVGVTVGLIALKVSALLNPVLKKFLYKGIDNSEDIETDDRANDTCDTENMSEGEKRKQKKRKMINGADDTPDTENVIDGVDDTLDIEENNI